jgi:hypothetical protein
MDDEKLEVEAALREWESKGGSPGSWTPVQAGASSPRTDGVLDARHRRGSIGPAAAAPPLGEAASGAALQSHLAHLLDARGDAMAPPSPTAAASSTELGDDEDLERQPDGVPHLVIGLTALVSVVFAAVLISLLLSGPTLGSITVAALALVAVPFIVSRLGAKAERDRDHEHPSR